RTGNSAHFRLPAELSFRTYFARDARHFRRERTELIDHRVDGVFQLQDFSLHIDRDLLREIAICDRGRDFGDVTHLTGQVTGHEIHGVSHIRPRAGNAAHLRLTTEFSFRPDLARHTSDFGRKRAELINHRVDRVLQFEDLAFNIHRDLLAEVTIRDRGC